MTAGAVTLLAAAGLALPQAPASAAPAVTLDLATAGVPEVQAALAAGQLTSVDLVQAYLDRIDQLSINGPHLNAVRAISPDVFEQAAQLDAERAAGNLRGPLHGIPILLKDNIDVAGLPTTAGSIALADSYPAADAPLTADLREAGVIILGKTNLSEFANFIARSMPSGYSSLGGQVINPYDASQTPSGSSSGSGVAAAAGLATLTIGTETSGSILSPARANSVVGVKPTVGLVSRTGIIPIAASQDTAGPMTKTVYDAAALLGPLSAVDSEDAVTAANPLVGFDFTSVLSDQALAGARLGVVANDDPLYQTALAELQAQGAELVPVTVGNTDAPSILVQEFKRDLNAYLSRLPAGAPMQTFDQIRQYNIDHPQGAKFGQYYFDQGAQVDLSDPVQLADYEQARDQGISQTRQAIDLVLTDHQLDAIVSFSQTTGVGARAGYPSVSVPAGYAADNLRPASIVFLGTAWSEPELLALAYDYEQAAQVWRSPEVINPSLFRCSAITDQWTDAGCPVLPVNADGQTIAPSVPVVDPDGDATSSAPVLDPAVTTTPGPASTADSGITSAGPTPKPSPLTIYPTTSRLPDTGGRMPVSVAVLGGLMVLAASVALIWHRRRDVTD
ncbi:MAG: amidase [Propionibacteriaceae bacterium]|nr:amidase [Propionibacteriaceae bacterium]